MIGPGRAFDTDKYFIICSNVLGGCRGSTGPSSINPRNGQALRPRFPSYHREGHGKCPAPPHRPPRHRAALVRLRRVDGRDAGPAMGRLLSGQGRAPLYPSPRRPPIRRSRSPSTRWAGRRSWPTRTGMTATITAELPPRASAWRGWWATSPI